MVPVRNYVEIELVFRCKQACLKDYLNDEIIDSLCDEFNYPTVCIDCEIVEIDRIQKKFIEDIIREFFQMRNIKCEFGDVNLDQDVTFCVYCNESDREKITDDLLRRLLKLIIDAVHSELKVTFDMDITNEKTRRDTSHYGDGWYNYDSVAIDDKFWLSSEESQVLLDGEEC